MAEIVMPRLSDSMEEGTVLAWLKKVGDEIGVGDEIVEIETDKANMAYESDVAGTLTEILAEEGATLPIGEPIARVGDASDTPEKGEGVRSRSLPLLLHKRAPAIPVRIQPRRRKLQPRRPTRTRARELPRAQLTATGSKLLPSRDGSLRRKASTCPPSRAPGPVGGLSRRM
jgi:pyruvate dehydrogenase E2 component (dihydrolipoamide acetyltransferase)